MQNIIVDPEFQNKIPRLSEEEFSGLREDILADGYVRDPLTVWEETNTLLDGHNRWKIIAENWDGKLPVVSGSGSNILDVSSLTGEAAAE